MIRLTRLERVLAGGLIVVVALVAGLAVVGRHLIDQASDKADAALKQGSTLTVRVDGLESIKPQVDDALAQARELADRIQAGVALDVSGLRSAVDSLVAAVRSAPALAAQAGQAAAERVAALLDAARGIVADLGRALAPVEALASGVPVTVGGTARLDVHVLAPLVDDLLGLLPQITARLP